MELLRNALQSPFNNLLGVFIYLLLIIILTITATTILLYLIPNRFSRSLKNGIVGSVTFLIMILWLYIVVMRQLN
ncbi:hypothetical protein [Amphibacillus cookii]|uniref:hypothetical protein n=1 Tax=Amphibacillus cookii TaxID=767787 RepID=UPI00195F17E4|nr:hypothetical protein [Amphibacillus cookii]MBM7540375.1 hypothetical protein [Amphibacillus cookii]